MGDQPTSTVVLVFGAGITGYRRNATLDQESLYALNLAVELGRQCGAPIIALAGYSEKYDVHFGELFARALQEQACQRMPVDEADYATVFNSIGEARAFWRWVEKHYQYAPSTLQHVRIATRGAHSWRTWFLVWKLRPHRYRHVQIHRHQARSDDSQLLWHELTKGWPQAILYTLLGKLRPDF